MDLTQYTPGESMSGTIGSFAATSSDGVILNGSDEFSSLTLKVFLALLAQGDKLPSRWNSRMLDELIDSYMKVKEI